MIRIHAKSRATFSNECRGSGWRGRTRMSRWLAQAILAALAAFMALPASELAAFERMQAAPAKPEMRENCPGLVAEKRPQVVPADFQVALNADQARITYVGHSTFLIESPQLVRIAPAYNNYVRPPLLPDIITMNHAHGPHYSDYPDPPIRH